MAGPGDMNGRHNGASNGELNGASAPVRGKQVNPPDPVEEHLRKVDEALEEMDRLIDDKDRASAHDEETARA